MEAPPPPPVAGTDAGAVFVLESKGGLFATHHCNNIETTKLKKFKFFFCFFFLEIIFASTYFPSMLKMVHVGRVVECRELVARGVPLDDGHCRADDLDASVRVPWHGMGPRPRLLDGVGRRHLLLLLPHVQGP